MNGATLIAETFKRYGVTHVFFVEAILRRALLEMESLGIRRVLTHSEKAAAYMADGYARMSRRPGICMAQSVGAANLASGLQDAFLGRSPVIAITGRKPPVARYRHAYQEIQHAGLFSAVTKFAAAVDAVEQLPFLLHQAFREATSGSPGPVHLDLVGHQGDQTEDAEAEMEVLVEKDFTRFPSKRSEPSEEDLAEAARLLEKAERPVIVAGGGTIASGAQRELVELAETLDIPIATSPNGKGAILENHPLSVGVVGRYSRWCANRVVSEADLVLYVGSNTGDMVTNDWTVPKPQTRILQIDIDPSELGRSYPGTAGLLGDAALSLRKLKGLVKPKRSGGEWVRHAQSVVSKWRAEQEPLMRSDAEPIRPERLCRDLGRALPPDSVLVADTGQSTIWTAGYIDILHPDQRYIRCAGSLGWAFPASLGVKCAAPEKPVVCFTGDGGFWYHLAEFETAVRCGIHTVTVVNNNSALGQCFGPITRLYRDRPGTPGEMCLFSKVNFAKWAENLGGIGFRVERADQISEALNAALSADRPCLVDVVTDVKCEAPDPWKQK